MTSDLKDDHLYAWSWGGDPTARRGIRGMDVTPAELRSAGVTLAELALRAGEQGDHHAAGQLAETLLALGVGEELTVRGRAAHEHWWRVALAPTTSPEERGDDCRDDAGVETV